MQWDWMNECLLAIHTLPPYHVIKERPQNPSILGAYRILAAAVGQAAKESEQQV